jgi:hypothetical protein
MQDAPPDAMAYSKAELDQLLIHMDKVAENIYWYMFKEGIGGSCHAMLEFCGLLNKYVGLCRKAHEQGIQFPFVNTHSGTALPMETHDADYLAEKFDCIFGAYFKANPQAAKVFAEKALGLKVP